MSLAGRDLITLDDYTVEEITQILDVAEQMSVALEGAAHHGDSFAPLDRILATCFYEPSTRTRLSFSSAMLRLGGSVICMQDPKASSVAKGESLADTMRMMSSYADIIVIRHAQEGSATEAAAAAAVPVINAGDGTRNHPTQTLTDLFTLRRRKGTLSGLKVGLCGDLKYGRTVHSLAPTLARLGSEMVCIAPPQLSMPAEVLDEVERLSGHRPTETADLPAALAGLDMLYMTRIQRERFPSVEEYEQSKGVYVLDASLMKQAPAGMIVLHPLPRVDEITTEVDDDPRAAYFEQAAGGVPVRMALIALLLGIVEEKSDKARCGF
ncbi:MAG TPA: aspartate carbamoyltransferase [Armatimonadota bacterium]|jgi:aspartate carbamoyltransferase catalytic subunit